MVLMRFFRVIARHPARMLAVVMALGVWGVVAVNAAFMQGEPHPAPLIGREGLMRAPRTAAPPPPLPPVPAERQDAQQAPEPAQVADPDLVREVQALLAERGFYGESPDGNVGPVTEAAIRAYQRVAGLDETGEPTSALLAHIALSSYEAPPAPRAPIDPDGGAAHAVSEPGGNSRHDSADASDRDASELRIEAVQRVLADLGYAPGPIDGEMGPSTEEAIRRFEADRGMTPSGRLTEELLRELSVVSGVSLG